MMTHAENEALTGVVAGKPLHAVLARYWYPIMKSAELADRCTHKTRLLGETFVVARRGKEIFAMEEGCPHRMASLTLARVEDGGLRCIYHGWLMDTQGRVAEAPNERESGGRPVIQLRTAKLKEAGGLIWMNICENDADRAPFPDLPWLNLPVEHVVVVNAVCNSNWVQSLEGSIDSSHSSHLHSDEIVSKQTAEASTAIGTGMALQFKRPSTDRHPRIKVRDTDCGFIYGAIRKPTVDPDKLVYVRATAFAFPAYVTFPSGGSIGDLQIFVPMDDQHTHFFYVRFSTEQRMDNLNLPAWSGLQPGTDVDEAGRLRASARPLWGQDRAAMAAGKSFSGLTGVNLQDIVVQESMGPVVDRTREHLGPADLAIIHFRKKLLEAAAGAGAAAPEFARGIRYQALKARDGLLPIERDWSELYPSEEIRWTSPA